MLHERVPACVHHIPCKFTAQAYRKKHGTPELSRWNGKRNPDKSTTGHRQSDPVCSHQWWRWFEKEFPAVRKYKTSSMSIMRAKKATPAVRDDHFKGFIAFLNRYKHVCVRGGDACMCMRVCVWFA